MTSGCSENYSALNGRRFRENEGIQKRKCDDGTESYSTAGVPKMFPEVAASMVLKGSTSKVISVSKLYSRTIPGTSQPHLVVRHYHANKYI
jgi:hypothetical protein